MWVVTMPSHCPPPPPAPHPREDIFAKRPTFGSSRVIRSDTRRLSPPPRQEECVKRSIFGHSRDVSDKENNIRCLLPPPEQDGCARRSIFGNSRSFCAKENNILLCSKTFSPVSIYLLPFSGYAIEGVLTVMFVTGTVVHCRGPPRA